MKRMNRVPRVLVTDGAKKVIDQLRKEHGELMFHQSGGCCDGSSPMCFRQGQFRVGASDVLLGQIHGCPFYMSRTQFEYWKHTQLTVDIIRGRGASFSLEIPLGLRFLIRSRPFTKAESENLEPVEATS
ncbi:UDP-glucose 4-epimerase [Paludifilum halophilum]|uniref:UDP-glucose 4-epimerase n=2 Tax=Paludifilum halophilum TaxID=1642702 RepID=A0A235BD29_9BACL|nr:UDP-glucose 4-epimerase [Paludifilum halophilum]